MSNLTDQSSSAELKSERIQLKSERIQLDRDRVHSKLADVPGWQLSGEEGELSTRLRFSSDTAAAVFVRFVAQIAMDLGHQPRVTIEGSSVTIQTHTPEVNGLTDADFELAVWVNGRRGSAP